MAATTYSKLRHAVSRAPPFTTRAAFLCTQVIKSVINERIYLDKPTLTSFHNQIRVIDHAYDASMDDDQKLSMQPKSTAGLVRIMK
jgi:hypothetical protein